jgi:enoyl-CoA hydratase/carnithine racemase
MQQAYRVLRVVAEAQTIRMVLMLRPSEIMLSELCTACTTLDSESSRGIKAVVLDFQPGTAPTSQAEATVADGILQEARRAVQTIAAPVLAVVRGNLSETASALMQVADLTLVAHSAVLPFPTMAPRSEHDKQDGHRDQGQSVHETLTGEQALRLGLINWSVPTHQIDSEMERILDMLREKSAIALRLVKASVHLGASQQLSEGKGETATRLAVLEQINEFYPSTVMQTADASEGLQAFLEKRKPQWQNK